ncbi:MAG: peptidoglycan DD-metalloendopeptidase family protein [Prevotellaceae bacterium]|nr:peptidoglycan DD-metalloendopeptidase family protein [Prevotellaceae bacterium]
MRNYKKTALIFIVLFLPFLTLANGIKADTIAKKSAQIKTLIIERDTIVKTVDDTTFLGNYAIKITKKHITQKIFDTVYYIDATPLSIESPLIAETGNEYKDDDENDDYDENDIGGDEYSETDSEEELSKFANAEISYKIPASDIYPTWTNATVNPYKIDVAKISDTIKFEMYDFVYPLLKPMHITSKFGYRRGRSHNGIDLKLYTGDTVVAPMRGMVRVVGSNGRRRGYGNFVVIRHYNGLETVYGHLSKALVEINQIVEAGDVIALGGNTGRSSGSHLHWELRYLGNPINPEDVIDFETNKPKSEVYCMNKQKTFEHVIEQAKARFWTIKKGDTLGRISQRTGVPIKRICALNNITTKTILRIGRNLRYN